MIDNKSEHYNLVFITNLPAFYKINLYNRIAEKKKILVIFLDSSSLQRNRDFYKGQRCFEYISFENYRGIKRVFKLIFLLKKIRFDRLLIGGWDSMEYWAAAFTSAKAKNAVVVESSVHESMIHGFKAMVKRLIMKRFSVAYVSGKLHSELALKLGFKGELITTKGVGVFNIVKQPSYTPVKKVTKFIYVGRLSPEKNLTFLIKTFNDLPDFTLNVIGFGPQENELKQLAKKNVVFHGAVDNAKLPKYYRESDVFILPSLSEPWGLVVEEALNSGLPAIISNKVGCAQEVVFEDYNGIIFDVSQKEGLKEAILRMTDTAFYNSLKKNVSTMDFEKIAEDQVNCYC